MAFVTYHFPVKLAGKSPLKSVGGFGVVGERGGEEEIVGRRRTAEITTPPPCVVAGEGGRRGRMEVMRCERDRI